MYLLDTNACIRILTGRNDALIARFRNATPSEVALCSIVRAELEYGARHSSRVEQNLDVLREFCAPLRSLPFDDAAAETYGLVRQDLQRQGQPIGPNDLLIAAIARSVDAVLVTANTSEFQLVPSLRVENWEH